MDKVAPWSELCALIEPRATPNLAGVFEASWVLSDSRRRRRFDPDSMRRASAIGLLSSSRWATSSVASTRSSCYGRGGNRSRTLAGPDGCCARRPQTLPSLPERGGAVESARDRAGSGHGCPLAGRRRALPRAADPTPSRRSFNARLDLGNSRCRWAGVYLEPAWACAGTTGPIGLRISARWLRL